jgi:adenosylcobyric acid synthase
MVQGTASSVGKSLIVAGLCRLFRQDGLRVLPFKSQNMALNAFVTPKGGEISRAQAVQAEAAGVEPHVDMNPILLKPEGDRRSQVVLLGRAVGSMTFTEYHAKKPELRSVIAGCLERLRRRADIVVIEGAGSPAEVNLKSHEIVNMFVAKAADARVLLVGDIDKGGVFASLVGTLELLEPDERALVAGFLINKFRGDRSLLTPGLDFLTQRTGVPVLGVLPFVQGLRIADEDSVSLDHRGRRGRAGRDEIEIAVVRLPRISNYDDLDPLEHEPGVVVRFVEEALELAGTDLVVLPGSKSTAADLAWMRQTGIADVIVDRAGRGEPVLGLCGGCEMLGREVHDPDGVESPHPFAAGLGLLPLVTRFERTKITAQVVARYASPSFLTSGLQPAAEVRGYEIHMGRIERPADAAATFTVVRRNGELTDIADGAVSPDGTVVGTMLHGILENDSVRASLLGTLRRRRGLPNPSNSRPIPPKDGEYDRLAAMLRENVDLGALRRVAGLSS